MVHHTTRDDKDFTGAGNWFNSADSVIKLSESNGILTLEHRKAKYGEKLLNRNFQLIKASGYNGRASLVVVPVKHVPSSSPAQPQRLVSENQLTILHQLDGQAQLQTFSQLLDATKLVKSTLSDNLKKLEERGYITQDKEGYRIASDGSAVLHPPVVSSPNTDEAQADELNWLLS